MATERPGRILLGLNAALTLATSVMFWFQRQNAGDHVRFTDAITQSKAADSASSEERKELARRIDSLEKEYDSIDKKYDDLGNRVTHLDSKIPSEFPPLEWRQKIDAMAKDIDTLERMVDYLDREESTEPAHKHGGGR